MGFTYGAEAFCDCPIEEIAEPFITNTDNLWNIRNTVRMFGMRLGNTKSVTNLGTFITSLENTSSPIRTNMAANLTNTDISDSALLENTDLITAYSGHSLQNKTIYS